MLIYRMNADDISRKADQERVKQKKKNRWAWLNREQKPVFSPKSPDSWYVYTRIYPHYYNLFIWIYLVMTIGVVFLALYYMEGTMGDWAWYVGVIGIGLFLIRIIIHRTLKIARFSAYKTWRSTLPFKLTGWEKLGSFKNFPAGRFWNHASLKVIFLGVNSQTEKLVKDALYLFTVEANKCFYEGWSGMDGRRKWKNKESNITEGSANSAVVGDMYTCINVHLRAIQEQYGGIEKVVVEFSDSVSEVDPKSTD